MDIAINTDILCSTNSPEPYLELIAEAGFTHLHWCHHWNSDFFYTSSEISRIALWLKEYGLKLLDIHGSAGKEKCFFSNIEYVRQAGVELVLNRVRMFAELGGEGGLILHIPSMRSNCTPEELAVYPLYVEPLMRSLDELMPELEKHHVVLAVENMGTDDFELIGRLMRDYPAEYLGITYDSGHGNMAPGNGLEHIAGLKERLEVLHLNDNDGIADLHMSIGTGTVDWERMAEIIATSHYAETGRPMSLELSMMRRTPFAVPELKAENQPRQNILDFLIDARRRGEIFTEKVNSYRRCNNR